MMKKLIALTLSAALLLGSCRRPYPGGGLSR